MCEPKSPPEPDEPFEDSEGVVRSKAYLEKKKLDLEIKSLKRKSGSEIFLAYVPFLTVLLGLIGLGFGFWQFRTQQDKWLNEEKEQRAADRQKLDAQQQERTAQYLKQLRGDVDEISQFTKEGQPISRVTFLLDDMKILIDLARKDPASIATIDRYEQTVTKALVSQIGVDADFQSNSKDVLFAEQIVQNWEGYKQSLKEDDEALQGILSNYVKAIRSFRKTNSNYVANVAYNSIAKRYNRPTGYSPKLFLELFSLLRGFKNHLALMTGLPEEKTKVRTEFEASLCNDNLAKTLFGEDFVPNVECREQ